MFISYPKYTYRTIKMNIILFYQIEKIRVVSYPLDLANYLSTSSILSVRLPM